MAKMPLFLTQQVKISSILLNRVLFPQKSLMTKQRTFFASQKSERDTLCLKYSTKKKVVRIFYYLRKMPYSFLKNSIINLLFFIESYPESKLFTLKISPNLLKVSGGIISRIRWFYCAWSSLWFETATLAAVVPLLKQKTDGSLSIMQ